MALAPLGHPFLALGIDNVVLDTPGSNHRRYGVGSDITGIGDKCPGA